MVVNKDLLAQQEYVESAGNKSAVNPKSRAMGVNQVLPSTAKDPGYGIKPADTNDPRDVARLGQEYLTKMVDKYGDRDVGLAAYVWGPGNVDKWLASGGDFDQLPGEVKDYIQKVNSAPVNDLAYGDLRQGQDTAIGDNSQDNLLSPDVFERYKQSVQTNEPTANSEPIKLDWNKAKSEMYDPAYVMDYHPDIVQDYKTWTEQPDMSDGDAAAQLAKFMRYSTMNDIGVASMMTEAFSDKTPVERKQALANLLEYWNNVPWMTDPINVIVDNLVNVALSPSTWLSAGIGGAVSKTGTKAGLSALTATLRGTLAGGAVDAASNAAVDAAIQGTEMAVGARKEYDPSQTGVAAVVGGGASVLPGLAGAAVGSAISRPAGKIAAEIEGREAGAIVGREAGQTEQAAVKQQAVEKSKTETVIQKVDPEYAGSINLDNIGVPESTKDVYRIYAREMGLEDKPSIGWDKIVSAAESAKSYDELVSDPTMSVSAPVVHWLRQKTANLVSSYVKMDDYVQSLESKGHTMQSDDLVEAMAARDSIIPELQMYMAKTDQAAADAGRALAIHRIPITSDFVNSQLMRELIASYGGDSQAIAKAVRANKANAAKVLTGKNVHTSNIIRKAEDMAIEAWRNNILANIDTILVNGAGAGAAMLSRNFIEAPIASSIAAARRGLGGSSKLAPGDVGARIGAQRSLQNWKDSFNVALEYMISERPLQNITERIQKAQASGASTDEIAKLKATRNELLSIGAGTDWRETVGGAIPGFVGKYLVRMPGRFMGATDALINTLARKTAMESAANAHALVAGQKGSPEYNNAFKSFIENPPKDALKKARDEALEATFQTDSKIAKAFNFDYLPAGTRWPFKFLFPFARTLTNIVSWGAQRTPGVAYWANAGKGLTAEEIMARQIAGSTYVLLGYEAYKNGLITSVGPEDWKERASLEEGGWRAFAVPNDDGSYTPFIRMDPIATPIQFGALIGQFIEEMEQTPGADMDTAGEVIDFIYQNAMQVATVTITEKTMLNSLGDLMKAFQSNDPNMIKTMLENVSAGYVPGYLNRIGQETDPYKRRAGTAWEKILKRTPFARKELPINYDQFGFPLKEDDLEPGMSIGIAKSSVPNTEHTKPLFDDVIIPLQIPIIPVPKDIAGVELTEAERSYIAKVAGTSFYYGLKDLHSRGAFNNMDSIDDLERKRLRDLVIEAKRISHNNAIDYEFPAALQREFPDRYNELIKAVREKGTKEERLQKAPDYTKEK